MRYLHADYVRRRATSAAHGLMASLVLTRATRAVDGRVPPQQRRRTAYYLTVVEGRVPVASLAGALGLSRSKLRRAIGSIEDLRDDASFDRLMDQLASEFATC
jgi:cation transport regulator ChaC